MVIRLRFRLFLYLMIEQFQHKYISSYALIVKSYQYCSVRVLCRQVFRPDAFEVLFPLQAKSCSSHRIKDIQKLCFGHI